MNKQSAIVFAAVLLPIVIASGAIAQEIPRDSPQQSDKSAGIAKGLELGHPIRVTDPVIPKTLSDQTGAIVLSAIMTKEGTFQDLVVAGGNAELKDSAITAVKEWLYTPSTSKGEPIELSVYITLSSNHGRCSRFVEPNLPFPTKPNPDLKTRNIYRIVRDMQPPHATYAPDPEYTQASIALRSENTLLLGVIVGSDGLLIDVWVKRAIGLGLDQKAVDTVRQWKFQPAMKDGEPVAVYAEIEVAFHLQ